MPSEMGPGRASMKYGVLWQVTQATLRMSPTLPEGPGTLIASATSLSKKSIWPNCDNAISLERLLNGLGGGSPLSGSIFSIWAHWSAVKPSTSPHPSIPREAATSTTPTRRRLPKRTLLDMVPPFAAAKGGTMSRRVRFGSRRLVGVVLVAASLGMLGCGEVDGF